MAFPSKSLHKAVHPSPLSPQEQELGQPVFKKPRITQYSTQRQIEVITNKILEKEKRAADLSVQIEKVEKLISDILELVNSFRSIDVPQATPHPSLSEELQAIQGRIKALDSAPSGQRPQATQRPPQTSLPEQSTPTPVYNPHPRAWNFRNFPDLSELNGYAEAMLGKGQWREALMSANKVLGTDKGNTRALICKANALILRANNLLQSKKFEDSIKITEIILTQLLPSLPSNDAVMIRYEAFRCKIEALISLNRIDEVKKAIEEL